MKRLAIWFLILSLFFTGCSSTLQPVKDESIGVSLTEKVQGEEQQGSTWNVGVTELGWPDPELAIRKLTSSDVRMFPSAFRMDGDVIWRTVGTTDINYENQHSFIQKLTPPYTEWENIEIPSNWEEDGQEYGTGILFLDKGQPFYGYVAERNVQHSSYFFATCNEQGEIVQRLDKIPENLLPDNSLTYVMVNTECAYAYQKMNNMLYQFSKNMKLEKEIKMPGRIESIVKDPDGETVYIFGHDDKSFVIWDEMGHEVTRNADKLSAYEYYGGVMSSGEFVLCDEQKMWVCDKKGNAELVYDFVMNDYPWEAIYGIEMQQDDKILMLGILDGEYVPVMVDLNSEQANISEKQEIVMAFGYTHKALMKSISRFNRQSDRYHISAITAEDGSMDAFCRRIQNEISAGGGPDILADDFLSDISGYIANGYFASLDGLIDEKEYLNAAIEGGKTNGVQYGLPYDFSLRFLTYSKEFADGRTSFTAEELMEAVENSDAKKLAVGCDAIDIIMWCGLYDNDNKDYIDWEKKESHISEEPFQRLLQFAVKYGDEDPKNAYEREEAELLQSGEAVAMVCEMYELSGLHRAGIYMAEKPAYLGYPRESGKGIYVQSRYLYMNANSENKEGVKEFFKFLLSEEEQQRYSHFVINGDWWGHRPYLPVNLEAFEYLVEYNCNLKESEMAYLIVMGERYAVDNLTDEQIEDIGGLLDGAMSDTFYASEIYSMVAEELRPYIEGQRSMEEAIRILDNRIQLYLDEQR